jgi:hypothetical protein
MRGSPLRWVILLAVVAVAVAVQVQVQVQLAGLGAGAPAPAAPAPAPAPAGRSSRSKRGAYPAVSLWDGEDDNASDESLLTYVSKESRAKTWLTARGGMTYEQVESLGNIFPALDRLDPIALKFGSKIRFLCRTLGGSPGDLLHCPELLTRPLEKHTAVRHAWLAKNSPDRWCGPQVLKNNCKVLKWLLEAKPQDFADMHSYRSFEVAFLRGGLHAARCGDVTTLALLVSHGMHSGERDRKGAGLLHWAAGGGHIEACSFLHTHAGLHVMERGNDGITPLHFAAAGATKDRFGSGGHLDMCRWLLRHGADPTAATEDGNTVLHWAAWAGGVEIVKLLVEDCNVNVFAKNKNGCSAAHWAASGDDLATCICLKEQGLEFLGHNYAGNTALNKAVVFGRKEAVQWIIEQEPPSRDEVEELVRLARLVGNVELENMLDSMR